MGPSPRGDAKTIVNSQGKIELVVLRSGILKNSEVLTSLGVICKKSKLATG